MRAKVSDSRRLKTTWPSGNAHFRADNAYVGGWFENRLRSPGVKCVKQIPCIPPTGPDTLRFLRDGLTTNKQNGDFATQNLHEISNRHYNVHNFPEQICGVRTLRNGEYEVSPFGYYADEIVA